LEGVVAVRKELDIGYIDLDAYTPIGDYDEEGPEKFRVDMSLCFENKLKAKEFYQWLCNTVPSMITEVIF
jgi:hypothetical protein